MAAKQESRAVTRAGANGHWGRDGVQEPTVTRAGANGHVPSLIYIAKGLRLDVQTND